MAVSFPPSSSRHRFSLSFSFPASSPLGTETNPSLNPFSCIIINSSFPPSLVIYGSSFDVFTPRRWGYVFRSQPILGIRNTFKLRGHLSAPLGRELLYGGHQISPRWEWQRDNVWEGLLCTLRNALVKFLRMIALEMAREDAASYDSGAAAIDGAVAYPWVITKVAVILYCEVELALPSYLRKNKCLVAGPRCASAATDCLLEDIGINFSMLVATLPLCCCSLMAGAMSVRKGKKGV
ncbi:hypothetical protein F5Y14DRAFT_420560 [Nemania sp. NC0429]|nr:hypothetical protein F5Y14DRAFT_420560 [Nemania sp. NC0429]